MTTAAGHRGPTFAQRERRRKFLAYTVLVLVTAFFFAPIAYMIIGSFKPANEVLNGMEGFLPTNMSFDNYVGVINRFNSPASGYFWNFYLTSAIVSFVIVLGGLVVNSMIAYALARLRWRGRNSVLSLVVLLVILPFEAIAVPLFYLLNDARNTYYVQFLPFVASAFSIFLFYTFFIGLPASIQESARLDGAGPWRVYWSIIVPMSKPVFASVTILSFLAAWSSFLFPVMMVDQPQFRPLPLAIAVFKAQPPTDWGQIFAFGVLLVIPVVVVFLMFQRFFIQSVASSAVKG
ncbi:carbohydrate ABC transporter permease [Agromyces sp. M3QZ16-3]|uniref:carbohydrate ABC transporter permease n=1 Tax=Agromyces sp. M3QZ16-3 TaxID=3447585 RepID=UPI003F692CDA